MRSSRPNSATPDARPCPSAHRPRQRVAPRPT
jgi:hypothetical protein